MTSGPPVATYRIQLSPEFGFERVRQIVPYLKRLGVTHMYLSPVFEARRGSQHGYDVTDPTRLREELGGESGFVEMAREVRDAGLAIIIDIVPNHMAAHAENAWWTDVLMRGSASAFARCFDIDWDAGNGRLVLPILGRSLEEAIAAEELRLDMQADPLIAYFDRMLPIAPTTDLSQSLAAILDAQAYRLTDWRSGAAEINYRRFFDINDLVCMRVEDYEVFETTHALVFRLLRKGMIAGVRVDHIDGLADPKQYLDRLRDQTDAAMREAGGGHAIVLVEKILGEDESLPDDWQCDGTTGYEFLNAALQVFIDPIGAKQIIRAAEQDGAAAPFDELAIQCKIEVAETLFAAELSRLVTAFERVFDAAGVSPDQRPVNDELRRSIMHVSAALPVYRTYISAWPPGARDRAWLSRAFSIADQNDLSIHPLIRRCLLAEDQLADPTLESAAMPAMTRWQQFTGPLAAKGVEDTALYRHAALMAMNTVGGEPAPSDDGRAVLMRVGQARSRRPLSLNATATHDTKRGEDTRLRIAGLSQMPDQWLETLQHWRGQHASVRAAVNDMAAPSRSDEIMIYQTLLALWPALDDDPEVTADRVVAYMRKASREAKRQTSWHDPNAAYEAALESFVRDLVTGERGRTFREEARPFGKALAFTAAMDSLTRIVLKCILPGVPDFYQGTEVWDLSLVDPDNRRAVDFALRDSSLDNMNALCAASRAECITELLRTWPDGRIKLFVTAAALHVRAVHAELLANGQVVALHARGPYADHVIAFARRNRNAWLAVIAQRHVSKLTSVGTLPLGSECWKETEVALPADSPIAWRDAFTESEVIGEGSGSSRTILVGSALRQFPIALLIGSTASS